MPEYKPARRPKASKEEQMREYRSKPAVKKKGIFSLNPKKRRQAKIEHEARTALPPQSPARRQMAAEQRRSEELQNEARRINERHSRQKKKKKKSMLLYQVLFSIVVIAVLSVLSVTVLFNISEIKVIGGEKYTQDEIANACGIKAGENLLRINTGLAEEKVLKSLVYIDSVSVSRGFPSSLIITVEDAVPMASIYSGGKYSVISYKGKLLDIIAAPSGSITAEGFVLPEATEIGDIIQDSETEQLKILNKIVNELAVFSMNGTAVINLTDTMNISIIYDDRIEMQLGAETQLHEKLYAASVLISEEIGENDRLTMLLQNPERVVTRPIHDTEIDDGGYIAETTAPETTFAEGEATAETAEEVT